MADVEDALAAFFAATFLAGAAYFATFAECALAAAFLTATFLAGPDFLATGECACNAALFSAQRLFKAATILARPALLSLRFGFGGSALGGIGTCFLIDGLN